MRKPSTSTPGSATVATTSTPCCSKIGLKRGPLPKRAGLLRCGKSCRLRWMNYLRPSVKRGHIAPDEEDLILRLHRLLGNRWSLIAGRIPGRTDNEIKNYWNTHLSKKLISQGIDPRTHKPLNPQSVDQQKASSSKPNNRKSSSPNNHHNNNNNNNHPSSSSGAEETTSGDTPIISNKENIYVENTSWDQHQTNYAVNVNPTSHAYTSLLNSSDDGCGMEMRSYVNDEDEDEDINYCGDDVFSSFLNSLINEEAFTAQQHQMQQQQQQQKAINGILPNSDPLISISSSTFGLGTGWESALLSSSLNQNEPSTRINEHVE